MKSWIVSCFCFLAIASSSRAAIVFTDDFSGSAATALSGQLADTGGGTWVANAFFKADGSAAGTGAAWLAYAFQPGYVYTASVDVSFAPGTATSIFGALSFTTASDLSATSNLNRINDNTNAYATWALRNGGGTTLYRGPAFSNALNMTSITQTSGRMKIVLDTTAASWSYTASLDGVDKYTSVAYSGIAFTGLGLYTNATSTGGVRFDNFSFNAVAAVPEPSTYGVILGLAVAILVGGRRRRC